MAHEEIYEKLVDVFRKVFKREVELRPDLTAADVAGWDSFRHIDILMATEKLFSIKLETEEIDEMKKLGDLVDLIETKTKA